MALALDTLAYARRLREAGFSEKQAEAQAEALAGAMTDTLATKQDLRELEARVEARFSQVDARLDHLERHFDTRLMELEKRVESRFEAADFRLYEKLANLERRMTLRLGGLMVAGIGFLSADEGALIAQPTAALARARSPECVGFALAAIVGSPDEGE